MIVGIPGEIKDEEFRVAVVPGGVHAFRQAGHRVLVQASAGEGSGFADALYEEAGGEVVKTADEVWAEAELVLKVKEPIEEEWPRIRPDQVVFTYLHLAASRELTDALMDSECVAIGYETVEEDSGELPLLTPMSEVAGQMAIQEGAKYLERSYGGRGILLGGVPGVLPAEVVVLGGGTVGYNAARMAAGMGAHVTVLDVSLARLRRLSEILPDNVDFLYSNRYNIREQIGAADLLVGAVLVPGRKAPNLVRREDLARMQDGAVIVDVAVDQGGCVETMEPTSHHDPIFTVDGVIHYGVTNMPGAVPRTSTFALTNATLPYALRVAEVGWRTACLEDRSLAAGVNVVDGVVVHKGVADAFGLAAGSLADHLPGPLEA